jgi:hypothetical protein
MKAHTEGAKKSTPLYNTYNSALLHIIGVPRQAIRKLNVGIFFLPIVAKSHRVISQGNLCFFSVNVVGGSGGGGGGGGGSAVRDGIVLCRHSKMFGPDTGFRSRVCRMQRHLLSHALKQTEARASFDRVSQTECNLSCFSSSSRSCQSAAFSARLLLGRGGRSCNVVLPDEVTLQPLDVADGLEHHVQLGDVLLGADGGHDALQLVVVGLFGHAGRVVGRENRVLLEKLSCRPLAGGSGDIGRDLQDNHGEVVKVWRSED